MGNSMFKWSILWCKIAHNEQFSVVPARLPSGIIAYLFRQKLKIREVFQVLEGWLWRYIWVRTSKKIEKERKLRHPFPLLSSWTRKSTFWMFTKFFRDKLDNFFVYASIQFNSTHSNSEFRLFIKTIQFIRVWSKNCHLCSARFTTLVNAENQVSVRIQIHSKEISEIVQVKSPVQPKPKAIAFENKVDQIVPQSQFHKEVLSSLKADLGSL